MVEDQDEQNAWTSTSCQNEQQGKIKESLFTTKVSIIMDWSEPSFTFPESSTRAWQLSPQEVHLYSTNGFAATTKGCISKRIAQAATKPQT